MYQQGTLGRARIPTRTMKSSMAVSTGCEALGGRGGIESEQKTSQQDEDKLCSFRSGAVLNPFHKASGKDSSLTGIRMS